MNKRTILFVIGLGLFAAGLAVFFLFEDKGQMVGGPCAYDTKTYPATIMQIDTLGDNYYNFHLIADLGEYSDTLAYDIESWRYLELEENLRTNLHIGAVITYEVKEILSGSCNPYITVVSLEPYRD